MTYAARPSGSRSAKAYANIGLETQALSATPDASLGQGERLACRKQWTYWKGYGQGWRETDASGQIVEYPLDRLDGV